MVLRATEALLVTVFWSVAAIVIVTTVCVVIEIIRNTYKECKKGK